MALQTSGTISASDIRNEFYDPQGEVRLSTLYRGGSKVPSQLGGTYTSWTYATSPATYLNTYYQADFYWNGTLIFTEYQLSSFFNGSYTFYNSGGYRYEWDFSTVSYSYFDGKSYTTRYPVRRAPLVNVNTSVPTSGTISYSNFYGARSS